MNEKRKKRRRREKKLKARPTRHERGGKRRKEGSRLSVSMNPSSELVKQAAGYKQAATWLAIDISCCYLSCFTCLLSSLQTKVRTSSYLLTHLPDWFFHNFGAYKSGARRSWTTLNSPISWSWGSKSVKGPAGYLFFFVRNPTEHFTVSKPIVICRLTFQHYIKLLSQRILRLWSLKIFGQSASQLVICLNETAITANWSQAASYIL